MSIHIVTDEQVARLRQEVAELKRLADATDRIIEQIRTREGTRPA